jgi:hypothetical protein
MRVGRSLGAALVLGLGCGSNAGHDGLQRDGSAGIGGDDAAADAAASGDDAQFFTSPDGAVDVGDGCASADAKPVRLTPTVWLVVDDSGIELVNSTTPGQTSFTYNSVLWTNTHDALMGMGGLVSSLQSSEQFGFVGCSSGPRQATLSNDGGFSQMGCPELTVVPAAPMNYAALAQAFPAAIPMNTSFGANPSTYHGLRYAIDHVPSTGASAVVLVYGGYLETLCGDETELPASLVDPFRGSLASAANDTYAQQAMIVAAQAGAAKGVSIFDINPGNVDANALATHQMIAQIGNTGFGTFTAQTTTELQTALGQILTSIVSCDVALSGTVVAGQECQGMVDVDGTPVACDDPNGWKLKDPSTIELVGTACTNLKAHADDVVHARFPCRAFTPTR